MATAPDFPFGSIAVELGFADLTQVDECLEIQSKIRAMGLRPKHLSEIMMEKGYLTREQVQRILALQKGRTEFQPDASKWEGVATADRTEVSFGSVAMELGLTTLERVREGLSVQHKMRELGVEPKKIAQILIEKGYLTAEQARMVMRVQTKKRGFVLIPGYRIERKLATGAMGTVFQGVQLSMQRPVALKFLPRKYSQDQTLVERFRREARAIAQLNHPNIIRGYDFGEYKGMYYFAMEFVEGQTVSEILGSEGAMDAKRTIGIAIQVARAMEHAQQHAMVHRDIKPENIIITRQGFAKLCDLGLAKVLTDSKLTDPELNVGTPNYVSPEQASGSEDIGIRSDIYSLGATLYHMVTGQLPFSGVDAQAVMRKHLNELPVPPHLKSREVPRELSYVILKMMEKKAERRYQNATELLLDLEALDRGENPPLVMREVEEGSLEGARTRWASSRQFGLRATLTDRMRNPSPRRRGRLR